MHHQQVGVACGEHSCANADRGTGEKSVGCGLHRVGQLHATHVVVLRRTEHARGHVGVMGVLRGLRQDHLFAVKAGFLHVDQAVEWRVLVTGNPLAGIQHRIEGLAGMVGKALSRTQRRYIQPLVQQEINGRTQAHGDVQDGFPLSRE